MTDRELLELAAKAAGLHVRFYDGDCLRVADKCNGFAGKWNPLTDDGDALRLAVKLGMTIGPADEVSGTVFAGVSKSTPGYADEVFGGDPYTATRRAIVCAAVEIGKAMP